MNYFIHIFIRLHPLSGRACKCKRHQATPLVFPQICVRLITGEGELFTIFTSTSKGTDVTHKGEKERERCQRKE
uniref:Uncharacterized protein n=1 Tax=Anguilla anguilla TaxID=7936 RepID=A0A0E9XJI1_ANGAN